MFANGWTVQNVYAVFGDAFRVDGCSSESAKEIFPA